MSVTVIKPGAAYILDPSESRTLAFDWDLNSLRSGATISTSTFTITPVYPLRRVYSITRSSNTATVTTGELDGSGALIAAAHGRATGDYVTVRGAVQTDYNITAQITVTGANTFTYTVANSPTTPATGTISYLSPSLSKDNPSILSAPNATIVCERTVGASRVTQVRLIGTTATLGDEYELANTIVTDETPTQTKEQSIRVLVQNR